MNTPMTLLLGLILLFFNTQVQCIEPQALQHTLDKVRHESGVQGIAVSILDGNTPPLIMTSGFADLEKKTPIDKYTQFRFGSVAKVLVAMSIMKLVEEGKLSLDSKVLDLAPEIAFTNPYKLDHPLRVEHLLNHTTGWDGMRFAEQVTQSYTPVSTKQALEIYPASRVSRWPPGSRFAYNNTGPLLAAYIVEKLSGISFEAFVKKQFFSPLTMSNSDYFYTDHYRKHQAVLYLGKHALPYQHINNRAAGGLNSNIEEMGKLVQFLMTQGIGPTHGLLSAESFSAMQTPRGSLPSQAGVEMMYAQGVNVFHANGQILYGHEGSVRGGSALIVYGPQLQKGYVIAVNGEGPAIQPIHQILSNAITQHAAGDQATQAQHFSGPQQALSGFYRIINPGAELVSAFSTLMPWKIHVASDTANIRPLIGAKPRKLGATDSRKFSHWATGKTILVESEDPVVGSVVHYGPMTFQRISPFSAYLPFVVLVGWLLIILAAVLFACIWIPRKMLGKIQSNNSLKLRVWPLVTTVPLIFTLVLVLYGKGHPNVTELVGRMSVLSLTLFISSLLFLVANFWSLIVWSQMKRRAINQFVYWHSTLFILFNFLIFMYLLKHGLIGVRLWT